MNKDNKNNNVFTDQKFKEVVSKRGACMKVFENEDHSMTAAIYGRPVHYMKEGRWEEIDSRFTAGAEEEGDVEGDCGSMKLCLSNKAKEKGMVRIGQGEKRLTWGLVGCSAVKRELDQTGQDSCAAADAAHGSTGTEGIRPEAGQDRGAVVREAMSVKMPAGKAVYPEILPGTDLVYLTGPGILKENIIFKTAEAAGDLAGKVTWRYDTGRLMPEQAEDGQILFKDAAGAVIYQLAAPHMTDASGQKSTALRLSLEAGGKKAAVITLTADMEWLSDSQRVYPVTVDPEVSTPVDRASIEDCHVSSYYNTDNFYNSHILKTGCTDGSILRSYLKFTLPDIVKAADMVVGACLYLTKGSSGSDKRYIDVHRVKSSWNSRTLTWDNKPAYDANILDYASFATSGAALLTFDITGVVKDWYLEGKSSNNGLLIKEHGEEEGTYSEYVSSDDVTPDDAVLRPHIMIRYVNYSGLEDFWTYHDHGAGRAGTGYVNDYNGNQIFIHDTLTMSGSRAPIALKHIFNSNDRASDIGCGRGWRLNYHQTIVGEEIGTVQYYKHVDGDGTAHYFAEDSSSQWKDENNKELILTMDSSSTDAYYTITDKADHKRIFNSAGLLVKVQDANGNAAVITYSGSKIIRLTDGSGRAVALSYGTDGKLAKVTDPAGRAKTFAYSGGYLTAITDTDSAVSRFTYDTASGRGMMLSAEDPYGYRVQYSYHSQPPYRVTKIAEYAGTTAGQSISLSYGHNRTLFEDSKKRQEVYLFDDAGRTVSIRSHTGYGASWQYLDTERNANKLSAASGLQYVSPQYLKGVIGGMSGWSRYTTEDTITVADDGGTAYIGQRSIRISSTALTGHACAYQDLALVPGKKYVFSAYMKAGIKERAANGCIWLQVTNKDKNLAIVANSRLVTANTGFEDFKRLQVAFTAPASDSGVANLRILARMRYIIGDCWYDGLQLEEGEAAGRLNLVVNNCFSKGLDGYTKLLFATGDGILHTGEAAQVEKELTAIVNEDKVNLRKAAGTAYTALVQVPKNTAAYIAGADYDSDGAIWYAIRVTVSGRQYIGYMKGTYLNLSISGAHVTAAGVIAGGPLNIRSGPGTGYSSIPCWIWIQRSASRVRQKTAAVPGGISFPLKKTVRRRKAMLLRITWRCSFRASPTAGRQGP